jgi:hypothetical protein
MSCFGFSPPFSHRVLDCSLSPWLQCVSIKDQYAQTAFLPDFWPVLVGVLVVQCLQIRMQESSFDQVMRLKFQIARYFS